MKVRDLTLPEIAALLAERIDSLAPELLAGGRRVGREWAAADLTGAAPRTGGSLRVQLAGQYQGQWRDHATGEHGDHLDLIEGALALDKAAAVSWAKSWLGIDADIPKPHPKPDRAAQNVVGEGVVDNGARALAIWREAQPIAGTLAEKYLNARGVTIPPPPTLRYLAHARYTPADLILPALIAAVTRWPSRQVTAVQRTFLRPDGEGKASVNQPRMTLGPTTGGAVRLAPARPRLALAEGLETALSVLQACPDLPVWAVLGTSGFKSVILPGDTREVIIAADGDEAGEIAAQATAERFLAEGLTVRIARPPDGCNDFNDALTRNSNVVPFQRPGKILHV